MTTKALSNNDSDPEAFLDVRQMTHEMVEDTSCSTSTLWADECHLLIKKSLRGAVKY